MRQAVQDGLLREFDNLVGDDGTVDLVCDPGMEIPLELDNKTLTLSELLDALQYKRTWGDLKDVATPPDLRPQGGIKHERHGLLRL